MRVFAILIASVAWAVACSNPTEPTECTYDVTPVLLSIGPAGGSSTVSIQTAGGCAWSAGASAAWISITGRSSGSGPGTVSVSIAANETAVERTGSVSVGGRTIEVRQGTEPCTVTLAQASREISAAGGSGTLEVAAPAHCAWTAVSQADWLKVTSGAEGRGSGQVGYDVLPNEDTLARSSALAVGGQSFSVIQGGRAVCTPSLSPRAETFGVAGGTGTFTVTAPEDCAWVAVSEAGWIGVTAPSGAPVYGNGQVSYRVDVQPGPGERSGDISVNGASFTVTQRGTGDCTYTVNPVAVNLCMYDTTYHPGILIDTQSGCGWTVAAADSWLTIAGAQAGSGPGTIHFEAERNFGARRQGTLQVRWPSATAGQNVVVDQGGCTYAVLPTAVSIAAAGGSGSFQVLQQSDPVACGGPLQDRCVWTAATTAGWITIVNPAGQGDDTVRFTVAPNTSGSPRSATITLADKVVTITQGG